MTMLLLVGVFAALVPIPFSLIRAVGEKDRSQPFPCQDRPCACRTAEQCRKKCCCFTPQQKQAWAKRHGVKAFEASVVETKSGTKSPRTRQGCCSSSTSTTTASGRVCEPRPSRTPLSTLPKYKIVIGVFAQECQGVAQAFAGLPIFILPPVISLETTIETSGERLTLEPVRFIQGVIEPPVPPPRILST